MDPSISFNVGFCFCHRNSRSHPFFEGDSIYFYPLFEYLFQQWYVSFQKTVSSSNTFFHIYYNYFIENLQPSIHSMVLYVFTMLKFTVIHFSQCTFLYRISEQ